MNTPSLDLGHTNYHDDFPAEHAKQFDAYRCLPSRRRLGQIFSDTNINNYFGFGPHIDAAAPNRLVADTLSRYDAFLRHLVTIDKLDIVPACEAIRRRPVAGRTVCVIRHDIDGDIVTAVELARMEHAYGIRSTFNILHTAPYYGRFTKRPSVLDRWPLRYLRDRVQDRRQIVFLRNEAMIEIYRFIQDLGHEIGLHVDGLHVYRDHRIDGAAAIREELDWLRRNGIRIVGMAPHNSVEAYGAANSGLFARRAPRHDVPAGPLSFERDGITVPLQVLDEADCGIDYEIDDLYQLQPTDFLSAIGHGDWWFNRVYPVSMETPFEELNALFSSSRRHHLCQEHVLDHLMGPNLAGQVVLSVHPEHFGLRSHPLKGPLRSDSEIRAIGTSDLLAAIEREPKGHHRDLAQFNFEAARVQLGQSGGLVEYQTVVTRNEAGLHDFPIAGIEKAQLKAVLIGGRQLGTETIAPGARVGGRLRRKLELEIGGNVQVATFAPLDADGGLAAATELAGSRVDLRDVDIVVLGIDLTAPSSDAAVVFNGHAPRGMSGPHMLDGLRVAGGRHPDHDDGADWQSLVEGHRGLIDELKQLDAVLILLIEATGATDTASAARLAETAAARLALEFGVDVVNPFGAFAAHRSVAPTLWRSSADWSILGHEVAADLLCSAVLRRRADPSSRGTPAAF